MNWNIEYLEVRFELEGFLPYSHHITLPNIAANGLSPSDTAPPVKFLDIPTCVIFLILLIIML